VDPIKPTLKAPGIKLLKLKYDNPLSNFAFEFNLRRYIKRALITSWRNWRDTIEESQRQSDVAMKILGRLRLRACAYTRSR